VPSPYEHDRILSLNQGQIGFFPGSYISIHAGRPQQESLKAQGFAWMKACKRRISIFDIPRRLQGQIGFFPGSYISINAGRSAPPADGMVPSPPERASVCVRERESVCERESVGVAASSTNLCGWFTQGGWWLLEPKMCSGSEAGSYVWLIDFCITPV